MIIIFLCYLFFKVNISLGPLLTQDPPGSIDGWFPIYDTMHGMFFSFPRNNSLKLPAKYLNHSPYSGLLVSL